jgi:pimeloyl-ACP methyl ester carboxylesterase
MRHLGFYRAWGHIRADVRQWANDLLRAGEITEIAFTGHSLGGALAQVAAFDLSAELPVSHVISLGSACIGGGGMRRCFAEREIARGGRLNDRTRHFTYTGDVMPRIPPMSIFHQVGRRFRLPDQGGPIEGTEAGLMWSFAMFFAGWMSSLASFFMNIVTKLRAAGREVMKPLLNTDPTLPGMPPIRDRPVSADELFSYFSNFARIFPLITYPYAAFLFVIALATFPFIVLTTLYWYYLRVFYVGLVIRHGARNYREVFAAYADCINPPGPIRA